MFIEFIKAVVLGIVEGITEWLPISSTGHMILVDEVLKLDQSPLFVKTFLVVIQLGAILAVLILFFGKLNPYDAQQKKWNKSTIELWKKVLVASIPAAIIGLAFDDIIDAYLFTPVVVALMLVVYGVGFIIVENRKKRPSVCELSQVSYRQALLLGAFQVLALVPGTSRSGATILGGLLLKIDRVVVAEFSFFMAIPVMFGASLLKLVKAKFAFSPIEWAIMATGFLTAFVVSIAVIKFLMQYIKKHDFKLFGWYRIVLGAIILMWYMFR